jgi:uncharacterized protein YaaW (UPF0174 family)
MRTDLDLQFLQYCENKDLRTLCNILMYDNDGKIRFNENLSKSDNYLSCYPNNMKGMWKELASELRCYGGNTILNCFRKGQGPSYESIVDKVCESLRVDGVTKYDTAEEMEQKLLIHVSKKAIGELDESQARAIMDECGIRNYERNKAGLLAALIALQVVNYRIFIIVVETIMKYVSRILVGRGLICAGIGVFSGFGVFLGPIGWLVMGGWSIWDLFGPAYRVIVPAVIQVAYMRVKCQSMLNSNKVSA